MIRKRLAILALSGMCVGAQTVLADSYDPNRFAHNAVQPGVVPPSERGIEAATEKAGEGATQASLPAAEPETTASVSTRTRAVRGVPVPGAGLRAMMERHARENGIPVSLVEAVARVESRFNPSARNGPYTGLMQIHPRTAAGIGYRGSQGSLFDPDINLRYGVRYLAQAYRLAGGDTCGTIMRYQSGHGAKRMNAANVAYCAKVRQHIAAR